MPRDSMRSLRDADLLSQPPFVLPRRALLRAGVLGGALTLSRALALESAAGSTRAGRSGILVFLGGGPAHQDTFDLKPNAEAEYRGEFNPIRTNIAGVEICEHLPRLAQMADRYAVIRGLTHNLAAHDLGMRYLITGNRPTPTLRFPEYGCVVSRQAQAEPDLPAYVCVDRQVEGPGYLGAQYGALCTGQKPQYGRPFNVRGVTLGDGLSLAAYHTRNDLRRDLDTLFDEIEAADDSVRAFDRFGEQAYTIISSPRTREAFDLSLEDSAVVERFGQNEFGQSLLLACRLIAAGVRFVTVLDDGWDTHQGNFNQLKTQLLPRLDLALSAAFDYLVDRGLFDSTALLVTGEFGRTPKINKQAGRDHWARAMTSLMAGGSVRGGQALGRTNDRAEEPVDGGWSPDDLAATFYQNLGIDPATEFQSNIGRPITLVRDGAAIPGVL